MKTNYAREEEGMSDFFADSGLCADFSHNTDGRVENVLFEFKLQSSDPKLLRGKETIENQIHRYIQAFNAAAESLPNTVITVSINERNYYVGKVSTAADGKITTSWSGPLPYKNGSDPQFKLLIEQSKNEPYPKGWICKDSIFSYNNRFCQLSNRRTVAKECVKQEFENPTVLNIHPFAWGAQIAKEKATRDTNNWLTFNMNMLGDNLLKKQLGAFFTPDKYVRIATQYVMNAVNKALAAGHKLKDIVILDRCSGTGNLEKFLPPDILARCILNTIDYTEWLTLVGIYGGRVLHIIPHDHSSLDKVVVENGIVVDLGDGSTGLLGDGDALSERFYKYLTPLIKGKYVIMLENPPFFMPKYEVSTKKTQKLRRTDIQEEIRKEKLGQGANDSAALFIWSAWKKINPQEYILIAPIKYWKAYQYANHTFEEGHISNRGEYNAGEAGLPIIRWSRPESNATSITLSTDDERVNFTIEKVYHRPSERMRHGKGRYLARHSDAGFGPDFKNGSMDSRLDGGHVTMFLYCDDNALEQAPIHCANNYSPDEYWKKETVYKTNDGQGSYLKDGPFLQDCFLWTCFINRCISDGQLRNELCLLQKTVADDLLIERTDPQGKAIIGKWAEVLFEARKDKELFRKGFTYGLHQIEKDINVKVPALDYRGKPVKNKKGEEVLQHKHPALNNLIKELKKLLKEFYRSRIESKLFKYELLK